MTDTLAYLLVALAGVLAAALAVAKWRQRKPRAAEGERVHMKCPKCRHRLGYRSTQGGHKGMCGRCHAQFVFPAAPNARA